MRFFIGEDGKCVRTTQNLRLLTPSEMAEVAAQLRELQRKLLETYNAATAAGSDSGMDGLIAP